MAAGLPVSALFVLLSKSDALKRVLKNQLITQLICS